MAHKISNRTFRHDSIVSLCLHLTKILVSLVHFAHILFEIKIQVLFPKVQQQNNTGNAKTMISSLGMKEVPRVLLVQIICHSDMRSDIPNEA